jgi:molybdopterin synthase sulfur carrier subunit
MISVRLRFFAALREQLGASDSLQLHDGATVGQARDALLARSEREAAALARGKAIRAARNQVLCDEATVLEEGDELAFFPPVTGG